MVGRQMYGKKALKRMAKHIAEIEKQVQNGELSSDKAVEKIEYITSTVDFDQLLELDDLVYKILTE